MLKVLRATMIGLGINAFITIISLTALLVHGVDYVEFDELLQLHESPDMSLGIQVGPDLVVKGFAPDSALSRRGKVTIGDRLVAINGERLVDSSTRSGALGNQIYSLQEAIRVARNAMFPKRLRFATIRKGKRGGKKNIIYTNTDGSAEVTFLNNHPSYGVEASASFRLRTAKFGAPEIRCREELPVVIADPEMACSTLNLVTTSEATTALEYKRENDYRDKFVLAYRGRCSFDQKALNAQRAGANGILIVQYEGKRKLLELMQDAQSRLQIDIPVIMVPHEMGMYLKQQLSMRSQVFVSFNLDRDARAKCDAQSSTSVAENDNAEEEHLVHYIDQNGDLMPSYYTNFDGDNGDRLLRGGLLTVTASDIEQTQIENIVPEAYYPEHFQRQLDQSFTYDTETGQRTGMGVASEKHASFFEGSSFATEYLTALFGRPPPTDGTIRLIAAEPRDACSPLTTTFRDIFVRRKRKNPFHGVDPEEAKKHWLVTTYVLVSLDGQCSHEEKARNVQAADFDGMIAVDFNKNSQGGLDHMKHDDHHAITASLESKFPCDIRVGAVVISREAGRALQDLVDEAKENEVKVRFKMDRKVELAWEELRNLEKPDNWPGDAKANERLYYRQRKAHSHVPERLLYLDSLYDQVTQSLSDDEL